jgi:hypothetical protein
MQASVVAPVYSIILSKDSPTHLIQSAFSLPPADKSDHKPTRNHQSIYSGQQPLLPLAKSIEEEWRLF